MPLYWTHDTRSPLIATTEARAQATRQAALYQGLQRFPPDGRGPATPDRYQLPEAFTLDLWRAVRQAPIVRPDGSVRS